MRYNVPRICAALLCRPALINSMCSSSTLSVDCEYFTKITQEVTRLPFPFPAHAVYRLHPSYPNKGNGLFQKRVETVGVYPFCPAAGAAQFRPLLKRQFNK